MIWFEYNYNTYTQVIDNINLVYNYNIWNYIVLITWIIFIIFFSKYIIPLIKIFKENKKEEKEKKKKKDLIKKIILQKDIEDSISKELNIKD